MTMKAKKNSTWQTVNLKINKKQVKHVKTSMLASNALTMMQNINNLRNEYTKPNYIDLLRNITRRLGQTLSGSFWNFNLPGR